MTYWSALQASLALYQETKYKEAYDLISAEEPSPEAVPAIVQYLRYSFASRAGMQDLAIDILREAVVEKGYWYSSDHLDDSDLDPLRARSDFQELTRICRGREEAAKRRAHAEIELVHPQGQVPGKLPALVVALHGNQLNAATTRREWCVDSLSDCLVALPQSSHSVCADAYSWNDPIKGAHEVKDYVDGILHGNIADRDRVVLGGFSAGGRVVLHLLLKRMVRANGAILLGPWLPDLVSLEPMIPNLREDRVKVYLMCGDQDQDCYDSTNRLADLLRENGVPFIYQVFKGMGHGYPPDLDLQLGKAVPFILDGDAYRSDP